MNLLTELREGLSISWSAIRANKMRSILTTLGIVIGIVTVTLMATALEGLNRAFRTSISAIGADVLYVQRFNWMTHGYTDWMKMEKRRQITLSQANALEEELILARAVAPVAFARKPMRYKNQRSDGVQVIGTTEQFQFTSGTSVALGRFLSSAEVQNGRAVCVLGAEVATNLFPRETSLGNKVKIGNYPFEVIGVLEKQGSFLGKISLDHQVIIPLKQYIADFSSMPDCQVQVKVKDLGQLDEAKEELRSVMRRIRRVPPNEEDDFAINQQEQFISMFNKVAGTIGAVGLFITGLSLFVGGIGIMNIMFVSVAERTKEIGIRKAIGAKQRTILLQFLMEAAGICVLGGCIALAISWPLTLIIGNFLPAALSPRIVTIALLVSALTGVISGFLPAWRAARMNPVDALRAE